MDITGQTKGKKHFDPQLVKSVKWCNNFGGKWNISYNFNAHNL